MCHLPLSEVGTRGTMSNYLLSFLKAPRFFTSTDFQKNGPVLLFKTVFHKPTLPNPKKKLPVLNQRLTLIQYNVKSHFKAPLDISPSIC